ncbi:hypothetical protein AB0E55_41435 [Amycolatopsis keratiniphila]|uniref:hypothetical protein n=1 Tax=Amycolatopsis keratiniphila TaxID=129921 RepID=UPI0033E86DF0
MAVHRRGIITPNSVHQTSLGRVLVTIDGLGALRDLMASQASTGAAPPRFEFNGGHFDDPEDLRKLENNELRRVVVKSDQLEVVLASNVAVAIGEPDLCTSIARDWARWRRTSRRPVPLARLDAVVGVFMLLCTPAIALWSALRLIPSEPGSGLVFGIGLGGITLVLGCMSLFKLPKSYALVKPMTLDELRRERTLETRHWQTAAIALAAVTVALIGVLVTVLVKK